MLTKTSSILDYSMPSLDPSVFNKDLKLYEYQKDFVLRILDKMYITYDLKSPETWVEDVVLLGSLCTSKWLLVSDMDTHIRVNLDKFIETNMPKASKEEAYAKLDETRKLWDRAHILAPMTQHSIEAFFESIELKPSNIKSVGVYSLYTDEWLKEPVLFEADLDYEEVKRGVVEQAETLAEDLDSSLGTIKRNIQRVNELETVIKAWGKDKQQLFYKKIETKLNNIEEEIKKDLKIKQDLVDARHSKQEATSDIEIKFKWLQRFGFFSILQNLKELLEATDGEVTTDELPLIEKVISQASIKQADYLLNLNGWIAPDGAFIPVKPKETHAGPIWNNEEEYKKKYGIDLSQFEVGDYFQVVSYLLSQGWARVSYDYQNTGNAVRFGVEVADLSNIPPHVENFIAQVAPSIRFMIDAPKGAYVILETPIEHLQEEVNEAYKTQRLYQAASMQKFASFMKKAGSVIDVNGVRVFKDPTFEQMENLFENSKKNFPQKSNKHLRYVLSPETGELFVWDAYGMHHTPVMDVLGIPQEAYDEFAGDIVDFGDIEGILDQQKQFREFHPVSSLKQAFLKEAFEEEDKKVLDIDFDQTIAVENPDHTIGEPINGVKEVLTKLHNDGYEINIYSHRVTGEGPDEVREWLDKNEIPYDTILEVNKPSATHYIDDKNIEFHGDWNVVLKKVEKSDKTASLRIVAAFNLSVIDPKTFKRTEPYALFIGTQWDAKHIVPLDLFNIYPMTSAENYVPTVGLQTLVDKNIPVIGKEPRAGDKQPAQDISSVYKQAKLFSKKEITAQTKKIKQGDYSCLMALVPHDLAQEIVEWGVKNIPYNALYMNEDK